ncbi:NAD-dependent epimerase/dehydratase family protein [Rhizobium leguminosarum]
MARFAITGGTGFVGSVLAAELRLLGHEVILATRGRHMLTDAQHWVEYDLQDASTITNVIEAKPDGIFHLAWSTTPGSAENDPSADAKTNLGGLLAIFRHISKTMPVPIVFVSSGGTVYGKAKTLPIPEDHPLEPLSIYGITKVAAEQYAANFRALHGLDVRVARLSNPFGASQSPAKLQGAASIFARHVVLGEPITIWGDGSVVRDYIDIRDAAQALVAIMMKEPSQLEGVPTYNVGSGEGVSLNELVKMIGVAAGRTPNVSYVKGRSFDIPANILNITKLNEDTGWAPKAALEPAVNQMVATLKRILT